MKDIPKILCRACRQELTIESYFDRVSEVREQVIREVDYYCNNPECEESGYIERRQIMGNIVWIPEVQTPNECSTCMSVSCQFCDQ